MPKGIGYGPRPKVKDKRKGFVGKAGGHAAPVDTAGVDSSMIETITDRRPKQIRNDPLSRLMRRFGVNIDR